MGGHKVAISIPVADVEDNCIFDYCAELWNGLGIHGVHFTPPHPRTQRVPIYNQGETIKTIVITGTSSGIGKATVKCFAEQGWQVAVAIHSPS
ncbi:MAG: SDR family oxidoreductase [Caldilineaceae bacterium]|nr:SDR family oxidoreductase [Caldilineaceae bacterium]MBP8109916.1 SDR family oxidoreductase [Caldilineaceae bacterium]MBP8121116.1 SDR family oxidoreductase [Caldilineaceae bacterium]MBP9070767.1 SDR family oxidoreductase [Caldilineaceae bacterium]